MAVRSTLRTRRDSFDLLDARLEGELIKPDHPEYDPRAGCGTA